MKKRNLFIIISVAVALVALVVLLILTKGFTQSVGSGKALKETESGTATITQAYVSISAWGTDMDGDGKEDTAVLQYSPLVNISTVKEIAKFEIKNVRLSEEIKDGKTFVTWPKHFKYAQDSNSYYEPMGNPVNFEQRKDEGRSFSYNVVDVAGYTDEIGKYGGYVDFRYTIYGLGKTIDYEGILNSVGVYSGGKALEYAGVNKEDIDSPIEFDVVVTYADKSRAIKHFLLTSNFDQIYEQGFSFEYNSDEYVGKEF